MEVRPFARHDREQLRDLASAHAGAAMPGSSLPTATLLRQLEHPIGEPIVGPWVEDLATLVAIERDRLVAAAHLRRYGRDDHVGPSVRGAAEITWLMCWPDHLAAGRAVLDAALAQLVRWETRVWYGDGTLPVPGVYGVSDAWPHITELYTGTGFDPGQGQVEIVFAGTLDGFPTAIDDAPVPGVNLRRRLGPLATAFEAVLDGEVVGAFEVDADLGAGGTNLAVAGWADECNHWVRDDLRGRGIGTWLVGHAAAWLRLGGTTRFLSYAIETDGIDRCRRYYARYGLHPVNRTVRGWRRDPLDTSRTFGH